MYLLVIEDNPDLLENLSDFFADHGHEVDLAYNGLSGLDMALDCAYDVIILDLMLPGMDGLEVCARLRGEGCDTPLLMLTARDTLTDKLEGFDSGADDYLVKPFALWRDAPAILCPSRSKRPPSAPLSSIPRLPGRRCPR